MVMELPAGGDRRGGKCGRLGVGEEDITMGSRVGGRSRSSIRDDRRGCSRESENVSSHLSVSEVVLQVMGVDTIRMRSASVITVDHHERVLGAAVEVSAAGKIGRSANDADVGLGANAGHGNRLASRYGANRWPARVQESGRVESWYDSWSDQGIDKLLLNQSNAERRGRVGENG